MDVDPGTSTPFYFHFLFTDRFFSDIPSSSVPVCLLPYSHVPGMQFTSPLFLKAVSVISKQQLNVANTSSLATSHEKNFTKPGKFFFILLFASDLSYS